MGASLLPAVAVRLQAQADIQLTIRSGLNDSLLLALRQGEVDHAVTTMPSRPLSPIVMHERLFSDRVVVVGRIGHRLARDGTGVADLAGQRRVLPNRQVLTRVRLAALFEAHGLGDPDIWIETDSFPFMLEVLARTEMLSYMPEPLIGGHALMPLEIAGSIWRRSVAVSYWRRRAVTPASRMFLDALRAVAGEMYRG
jgi:DNA-binding transcriptional LysR family regulator